MVFNTSVDPGMDGAASDLFVKFLRGSSFLLTYVLPPLFAIVGLVGNYLSYILMKNPKYKSSTTCFYMRCVSFGDTLHIILDLMLGYSVELFLAGLIKQSGRKREFCHFYFFGLELSGGISPWLVVVMSLDRFVAVTWPLRAKQLCTIKRARLLTAVIYLISIIFSILDNFRNEEEENSIFLCPYTFTKQLQLVYDWARSIYVTYIPIAALFVLNFGIGLAVHRARKERDAMEAGVSKKSDAEKDSSITKMMIFVCGTYLVSSVPLRVHVFYWRSRARPFTDRVKLLNGLSYDINVTLYELNYIMNFYIYLLGCKRFRRELKGLVCRRRHNVYE
jgi:hypothetical protein